MKIVVAQQIFISLILADSTHSSPKFWHLEAKKEFLFCLHNWCNKEKKLIEVSLERNLKLSGGTNIPLFSIQNYGHFAAWQQYIWVFVKEGWQTLNNLSLFF